jgi:hypothetical protein
VNSLDVIRALDRARSQASNLMDVLRAGHVPGVDELDAMCRSAEQVHELCSIIASTPPGHHHFQAVPDGAWILPPE